MKFRKEWWYVIALAVFILVLMIVFRDEINFSPGKKDISENAGNTEFSIVAEKVFSISNEKPSSKEERDSDTVRNLLNSVRRDDE